MTLEWKKFSDEWPTEEDFPIAIYDQEYKEIRHVKTMKDIGVMPSQWCIKKELIWSSAKIEYPPLPEKKRHFCQYGMFHCSERDDGELFLKSFDYCSDCKFCPFCGWSKEKK